MMATAAPIERYARFLESLTPVRLGELSDHCAATVRFRDPFNDVRGIEAYAHVLSDMFRKLPCVTFTVNHHSDAAAFCYMSWTLVYRMGPDAPPRTIEGVSTVRFNAEGLVVEHVDHWDAASQLYEGIPVIGSILRAIRRRIAA